MNLRIIDYRPPRIAQCFVLTALLLHWLTPVNRLHIYSNQVLSAVLGAGGFVIMMWGWWLFRKYQTAICPKGNASTLITSGIYRFSRNPMYLGIVFMLLGIALFAGSLPFYLAAVAYFLIINNGFCPYEEERLAGIFGESYLAYKKQVRRWL